MALRLKGSSSGYAEIDAAAVAGDVTLTLPSTTGTINVKDGSGTTNVGTGVNLGNPGANIFTISNTGGERLRIAADGAVTIPGNLNISGVLTYEDVTSVDAIGLSTFRDGLITKDVGIATISSSVSDTAVDVFIYDTSKDSDGGAWRKRTSHTSWYNEAAAAGVRGSRREFPAVAVIVAEADKVTIYDGDDPDLPLWMVFDKGASGSMIYSTNTAVFTSITAVNGNIYYGMSTTAGVGKIEFINDSSFKYRPSPRSNRGRFNGSIADRALTLGWNLESTVLVNEDVNDVAMTVLPNAPVDSATGLPIPTIAVATDGGVSIIKDDGTVVDIACTSSNNDVDGIQFLDDNTLIFKAQNSGSQSNTHWAQISKIPSSDESASGYSNNASALREYSSSVNGFLVNNIALTPTNYTNSGSTIVDFYENKAFGYNDRLTLLYDEETATSSSVAYITSDHNTGWMHGDIKGAFLSDTDTTNISSTDLNLIDNGDFSNGTTGWSNDATPTFTVSGGGVASVGRNGGSATGQCYQTITTEVGRTYTVGVLLSAVSDGFQVYAGESPSSANITMSQGAVNTTGTHYFTFTASTTTTRLDFSATQNTSGTASFDNITIFDGVADRSVNARGLAVYGTITKSAVAGTGDTAAELVGYSNFSASNYLQQPYNSDLNFGTGDFSVMGWVYVSSLPAGTQVFASQHNGVDNTGNRWAFYVLTTGILGFYQDDGSSSTNVTNGPTITTGAWQHIAVIRKGSANQVVFYLDGVELVRAATTRDVDNTGNVTAIGVDYGYESPAENTSMALLRISSTVPSPEQIKKMYNDEKVLFQENANATLYGSSDAVTALAYDEVTDQLHVGTLAGRSDFQGLRRINNTTQQVQTAISAHDTFIIEQ